TMGAVRGASGKPHLDARTLAGTSHSSDGARRPGTNGAGAVVDGAARDPSVDAGTPPYRSRDVSRPRTLERRGLADCERQPTARARDVGAWFTGSPSVAATTST